MFKENDVFTIGKRSFPTPSPKKYCKSNTVVGHQRSAHCVELYTCTKLKVGRVLKFGN